MDANLNRTSLLIGVPGIILQFVGVFMRGGGNDGLALTIQLVGTVLLIVGLSFYARAKGYHGAWGLLGLLSCLGLLILGLMPDKLK